MLESIISFIVIFIECCFIGCVGYCVIDCLANRKSTSSSQLSDSSAIPPSIIRLVVFGTVVITVYTEFFSIFASIGLLAHLAIDVPAIVIAVLLKKRFGNLLCTLWNHLRPIIFSWEGFFYLCFIILVAFYTSRGQFHADTRIYHAQNIRIYEEYGLIKGMGNLQQHFGYNSASLAFASFFSYGFLLSKPWHTTTGFYMLIMGLYSFYGLKRFKAHTYHLCDMCKVGILLYLLTNISYSMSPATDYPAMLMTMFVLSEWVSITERYIENKVSVQIDEYIGITLLSIFVATLKLSCATMCALAIFPIFILIKEKRIKTLILCIVAGLIIVAPFLIRNVLITGWLLYPFDGINLFDVPWKVPVDKVIYDSDQIKVWGKCLYNVSLKDTPITEWIRVWWNNQESYQKSLIYANAIGGILLAISLVRKLIVKKLTFPMVCLYLSIAVSTVAWFLMAPFVRYGLCFLLIIPMLAIGEFLSLKHTGLEYIVSGVLAVGIGLSFSGYIGNYVSDDKVFVEKFGKDPYYIFQQDYAHCEPKTLDMNGNTIYYYDNVEDENDYYHCPSSYYGGMAMDCELMGERIVDGFKPL